MPDSPGSVVVFGGRSEIGVAVAERLASGRTVVLAARRPDDLADEQRRLEAAGATRVAAVEFDANDTASHTALIERLIADHGPVAVAVVAFGILGDQQRAETDVEHALQIAHTDYLAQISVLTPLATALRALPGMSQLSSHRTVQTATTSHTVWFHHDLDLTAARERLWLRAAASKARRALGGGRRMGSPSPQES